MIKKFCNCGSKFFVDGTNFNETKCPSCKSLNEARCKKPIVECKPKRDEIHFSFYPTYTTQTLEKHSDLIYKGLCSIDRKDNHLAVTINLFNFDKADKEVYKDIINSINHEYLHVAIVFASDFETSGKADNGLMKKLTEEGYI